MMNELHEECGVFGIYTKGNTNVVSAAYYALYALQHRGQESCGIAVNDDGVIRCVKNPGLVNEVIDRDAIEALGSGRMAVGHVRYGTYGTDPRQNAQPLVINHIKGYMALAHNGALTNARTLREELELKGSIFHMTSDAEVISYIITRERLNCGSIEEAVVRSMDTLEGAYSMVVMSPRKLIAARDPRGFRPLCIGTMGDDVVFASESCALDAIGAKFVRDIEPGEVVIVDENGIRSDRTHVGTKPISRCVFEYIYFARPDSVIDGSSVHNARVRAGAFLALEHPVQADVVIGVPDSGLDAAIGFARQSGIPYEIGFIKNKYIGRTFIQPTQADREDKVRIKLNVLGSVVKGKRVVLVDDSIVRGTTSARIVNMLREAGATEVHFRSSSPAFMYPCYYGTDVDSQDKLIACRYPLDEIAGVIGADSLGYLSQEAVSLLAENTKGFCTACFDGKFPCEPTCPNSKSCYETKISEARK